MAMEEGLLSEWLVADGATVEVGMPIYSIESDKSVQEVESPAAGTLHIIGQVGETYPVGELIGTIE
jgi:pyruvate/2-oxoglutarate dehydrogenase complex dihydrolipoamide acyltransferase (E2) component